MSDLGAWATLIALGAFHGVNPAMGWLFAVALGMQERRRGAVLAAILPIGLGHVLAIGSVLVVAAVLHAVMPVAWLRWGVGVGLLLFGGYKLLRSRHPRWVGMRVGARDLVAWSFLMASAHGAGLMLLPVLFHWAAPGADHGATAPAHHADGAHAHFLAAAGRTVVLGLLATGVHTLAYLAVMTLVALVVYDWIGLAVMRKAWFNLDVVWAVALVLAGLLTLIL